MARFDQLHLHLDPSPNATLRSSNFKFQTSNLPQANKRPWPPWRLIATHPNSKFALTDWNHRRLTFSNRNKIPLLCFQILSVSLCLEKIRKACFTLCGTEWHGHSRRPCEDSSSIQSQPFSFQNLIDTWVRVEFPLTRSKQTTVVLSNRHKIPPCRPLFRYNGSYSSSPLKSSSAEND